MKWTQVSSEPEKYALGSKRAGKVHRVRAIVQQAPDRSWMASIIGSSAIHETDSLREAIAWVEQKLNRWQDV